MRGYTSHLGAVATTWVEMADPDRILEVQELTPATDGAAFACKWFALGAALGIFCAALLLAGI
jgi:hypothetical protein